MNFVIPGTATPLSTEGNLTPRQLWIQGMADPFNSGYAPVASVHNEAEVDWYDYGIDESGPVPKLQTEYSVSVPGSPIHLSEEQLQQLQEVVDAARQAGDRDGLVGSFYLAANELLSYA